MSNMYFYVTVNVAKDAGEAEVLEYVEKVLSANRPDSPIENVIMVSGARWNREKR